MSIARACYVRCDICGDPAEVECNYGAKGAREIAKAAGWKRVQGRDVCPAHISWRRDERGAWRWQPDYEMTRAEAYRQHLAHTAVGAAPTNGVRA